MKYFRTCIGLALGLVGSGRMGHGWLIEFRSAKAIGLVSNGLGRSLFYWKSRTIVAWG